MRIATLLFALVLTPAPAFAQSFYIRSAHLSADGVAVGECVSAAVTAAPASGTHASVHFDGAAITFDAEVDLAQAHLQVGVGADTRLGGAFSPRMLRGTWAPVLAMAGNEVSVALPVGAPSHVATLTRGARGARGTPSGSPWSVAPARERDDEALHCEHFTLTAQPAAGATWEVPGVAARRRVQTRSGVDTIEVSLSGFAFTGYRRHDAECLEEGGTIGLANFGTGAGDGFGTGRVVVLPAGTQLFSSATAPVVFATLRADAYGIEQLDVVPAMGCRNGNQCERVPPLPRGPAAWIIDLHDPRGGTFLLSAWTHVPAETLADAPPNSGGFGMVRRDDHDWPTLH